MLANVLAIIPSRFIKHAFDLVQEHIAARQLLADTGLQTTTYDKSVKDLIVYSGLILLSAILKGLCLFLARQTIMVVGKRIEYALRNEIYNHYQTLPLSFYRRNSTGDLIARISEDVTQVGMYLGPAIAYSLNTAIIGLILIPTMLIINTQMTLYAMLPILLLAGSTYYISSFMQERSEAIQNKLSGLTTFVQESFVGIRVLQTFARGAAFTKVFAQECNTYKTRSLRLTKINAIFFPAAKSIVGLGTVLVVFIGGQAVIKGISTPGDIAEFVMYLHLLGWPVFSVSWINAIVQKAAVSQTRINEFLQETNPIVSDKSLQNPIKGQIAFKNVSFTYPHSAIKALQSVTFEVAVGQMVAILGTTGAGKSTIAHLLSRLYDASAGQITIDGVPIQDYAVPYLRKQLGYVPQDAFLFSGTFKDNIAWGQPEATDAQIIQAAQLVEMYESIQKCPKQMQTMLGERGVMLSGGQKQRIAIARALLGAPQILVLDDCLSAVDTQTEKKVLRNVAQAMQRSTVLLISHRVSSTQLADQIIVMEAGEIVEQGTHEDLVARKGFYYALYKQQQ